jgi:hypothetical protein
VHRYFLVQSNPEEERMARHNVINFGALWKSVLCTACLLLGLSGVAFAQTPKSVSVSYDFRNGAQGWQADFADYPIPQSDFFELKADIRPLPAELGINGTGFYIQGNNHSADLFMFLKKRLTAADGVVAGQTYQVTFKLVFASNVPSGCIGVGGAPGESVYMKAGASPAEPLVITPPSPDSRFPGFSRVTVDKSNQSQSGMAASVATTVANGRPCELFSRMYVSLERTHQHTHLVNANSDGSIWLLVGTDSGFEATTALYYQRIEVTLVPINPAPTPVLLTRGDTLRAAALDSVSLMREPFTVLSTSPLIRSDQGTRLTFFAYNLELKAGETLSSITVRAQDSHSLVYDLPVETVNDVPNYNWIKQITVKLPEELKGIGEMSVSVSLRGATSNSGLITIQ